VSTLRLPDHSRQRLVEFVGGVSKPKHRPKLALFSRTLRFLLAHVVPNCSISTAIGRLFREICGPGFASIGRSAVPRDLTCASARRPIMLQCEEIRSDKSLARRINAVTSSIRRNANDEIESKHRAERSYTHEFQR